MESKGTVSASCNMPPALRARFIIDESSAGGVCDRCLSEPVTLYPLVRSIRWWAMQWRMTGMLKDDQRIVGFVPEKLA